MRKLTLITLILIILSGLNLSYAQQAINGSRYILGYWDASQARWTKPFLASASQPATCAVGEVMFDTDATAGQNIYLCTATDTWTQVTGGSGPGASPGGSSGDVQYNNGSGGFGAEAALTYDSTTNILTAGKLTVSDTCTLGASTALAGGTLCWGGASGLLASDGENWYTANWSQNSGGEVWYSGPLYNPVTSTNFAFVTNILSVPTIKPTTSIRGTSSNVINLDPDSDGTIESNFDASGNFSGNAATATSAATAGSATTATTAGALSVDGTNCSAGQAPLGVDASGNAQSCFTPTATQVDIDGDGTREINLAGSAVVFDANEDGTSRISLDDGDGTSSVGRVLGYYGTGQYVGLNFFHDGEGKWITGASDTGSDIALGNHVNPFSSVTFSDSISFVQAGVVVGSIMYSGEWNQNDNRILLRADYDDDGTGEMIALDPDGDGTSEFVFDGTMPDCDGDGSTVSYDEATGKFGCGDDDTGGAGTQVDIDGDGTREISLSASVLSLDPDEDGTLESNFDANGRFSSSAVSLDADRDGTVNFTTSGTVASVDPNDDGTAQQSWDSTNKVTKMDLDQDGTWEYSFDGSAQRLYLDPDDDGTTAGTILSVDADISGDGTNDHILGITTASDLTNSPFLIDPRYAFTQFKDCTTLDLDVDGIPALEGTIAIGTTAAQLDANPQTGQTTSGYCTIPTGATAGNEFQIGWGPSVVMTTNAFIINKTNYFGTRLRPAVQADTRVSWVTVGAADYNADNVHTARTDALLFQCSPFSDSDGDGTLGDTDTDGTGTAAPDGDCADANEDSDDCNWYIVVINNGTAANDNGCLLDVDSDGSGDCDRDGTEDDAVTQTNRTAVNTGIKCNGDTNNSGGAWDAGEAPFQTLEIISASPTNATYDFKINGVTISTQTTNVPGNARYTSIWGVKAETNVAVTKTWLFDWMGWSSKRLTN
jgi:hypothetical protein